MKKCRPIMRACVFSPLPISLIGKLEEFEVSGTPGRASFSISANRRCLSARSSVTVSTTRSIPGHGASASVA